MAKPLVRSLALLTLAIVAACPAFAAKDAKKAGDIAIKALEDQIHDLRGQEKAALTSLDERFDYIAGVMDPKGIHTQLEEILVVLRQVKEDLGRADDLNFGGNRVHARESTEKAEHQVERALEHDTAEDRAKAANHIGAVHDDLVKGLAFSAEHPLAGKGADELQRRAVANQRLIDAAPRIALAHYVLAAVDHEITDWKAEKKALHEKHEAERKETKEQFHDKIKDLEEQLKALKK